METGWIKIYRKIKLKGYYKKSEFVHLWLHLLIEVNHEEKEFMWNGEVIKVKPGQFITGRKQLSLETGINESKVERILRVFENEQQIAQQKTTKFRLITLKNWTEHQKTEQQIAQQVNNKRTTSEQQVNTNKNEKNYKNEKNIYKTLSEQIELLRNSYPPTMVEKFLLYWDETDFKQIPRWKKEKTWDIKKRLERWKKQQEEWDYQKTQKIKLPEQPTQESKLVRIDEGFQKVDYREEYFKKYGVEPLN